MSEEKTIDDAKMSNVLDKLASENEDMLTSMYLTFKLGSEDYGIEVRYVTEIVGMHRVQEHEMAAFE